MSVFGTLEPRRFNFKPRYSKADKQDKIRFNRKTRYNPHERSRIPLLYIALLIMVGLLIYILGGVRGSVKPPLLTLDNVQGKQTEVIDK